MFQGTLQAIAIAPRAKAPLETVEHVEAVAGRGLAGDCYAAGRGAFQRGAVEPSQEVTLIESEAIAAAARDCGIELTHAETRRNLLTNGVPLNHLVGREFTVGDVVLRGVKLCEPCQYLEGLTEKGVESAFLHRGGLRAQVVSGGTLHVGDAIRPADGNLASD